MKIMTTINSNVDLKKLTTNSEYSSTLQNILVPQGK